MSSIFEIRPIERFDRQGEPVKQPREIACFSYDDKHRFLLDDSSIRYYYPPTLGADLSRGFDTFEKLDDTEDDHLDSLLKAIIDREQKSEQRVEASIITWRGMMTKLMAAIYSDRDGFEMNATLFQDTIFIEENHEYKLASQAHQSAQSTRPGKPSQDMMSFWGYKFETLCLLPDTWGNTSREYIENRENEIVNNYAQYCSIVKTGIGNTTLVIGGEVDAVWDSKPSGDSPINWVELKTSAEMRDMVALERKLLKFWIQSFLLGVPKIIVGYRTPDGFLKRVEEMQTISIPGLVKWRGKNTWNGTMCINFASSLLDFIKATVTTDGVWRIRRRGGSPTIEVFKIVETGTGAILSDEFISWREKFARSEKSSLPPQGGPPSVDTPMNVSPS